MKSSVFSTLGRFILQWVIVGFFAVITVVFVSFVYANTPCGALPTVSTGSGLTATAWNDLIAHVNQSVKQSSEVVTVSGSGVGIGITTPAHNLDVSGDIYATGKICVKGATGDEVCLEKQKWDPLYLKAINNYTGKYPTNNQAAGAVWKWLKQEWDEYGRAWCQKQQDLYHAWSNTDVANCKTAYPGDGNTLQSIINNNLTAAVALNYLTYQIMWGNTWIPTGCSQITSVYICDGGTACGSYPWRVNTTQPDYLYFKCIGI